MQVVFLAIPILQYRNHLTYYYFPTYLFILFRVLAYAEVAFDGFICSNMPAI